MSVVIFLQNEESLIRILNFPFMVSRAIASRQQIIKKLEKRLNSKTLELHFLSMVGKVQQYQRL